MDAKTTAAVANLRAALEGYPRGTKRHVPKKKGAHEMHGALVPVICGDAAAACDAVPEEQRTKAVNELRAGLGKLAPELAVTLCADDVFDLLDLVPKE